MLVAKFSLPFLLVADRDILEPIALQKIHLCHGDLGSNVVAFPSFSLISSKRENRNVTWKCSLSSRKPSVARRGADNSQNGFLTKAQYRPIMCHKMQICIANGGHKER